MTKGLELNHNDKYFYCRKDLDTSENLNYFLKEEVNDEDFLSNIDF